MQSHRSLRLHKDVLHWWFLREEQPPSFRDESSEQAGLFPAPVINQQRSTKPWTRKVRDQMWRRLLDSVMVWTEAHEQRSQHWWRWFLHDEKVPPFFFEADVASDWRTCQPLKMWISSGSELRGLGGQQTVQSSGHVCICAGLIRHRWSIIWLHIHYFLAGTWTWHRESLCKHVKYSSTWPRNCTPTLVLSVKTCKMSFSWCFQRFTAASPNACNPTFMK